MKASMGFLPRTGRKEAPEAVAEVSRAKWESFAEVRATYRSADVVGGSRVIFNMGGNKCRLVVKIAHRCGTVFVRFVGTHDEYDTIDPETI